MRLFAKIGVSLAVLLLGVRQGWAEDAAFRLVDPQSRASAPQEREEPSAPLLGEPVPILLGQPILLAPASACQSQTNLPEPARKTGNNDSDKHESTSIFPLSEDLGIRPAGIIFRAQAPPPPVDPFGGGGPGPGPAAGPVYGPTNPLDCGVPGDKKGNFWERFCQHMKDCGKNFGSNGIFTNNPDRKLFQSDHEFDMFSSPVSNPFFLLDPRSLTEVKPLFIYQQTRGSNPIFNGGSNFFVGLQGSLAVTDWLSFKISEFGVDFMEPDGSHNPLFSNNAGISELHIGPQLDHHPQQGHEDLARGRLDL